VSTIAVSINTQSVVHRKRLHEGFSNCDTGTPTGTKDPHFQYSYLKRLPVVAVFVLNRLIVTYMPCEASRREPGARGITGPTCHWGT
jgi:hypothetical protein